MVYYARSENSSGRRETVKEHLEMTARLCRLYAAEFGCGDIGEWMGLMHDFGKYGERFQKVLEGKAAHVDHSLAGAVFMSQKLGMKNRESSSLWPAAAAVRCHHGKLRYDFFGEMEAWAKGETVSPAGGTYSLSAREAKEAAAVFKSEITLPLTPPKCPCFAERHGENGRILQKMLFTRMLFSALTDADYSAAAQHFDSDYLKKASLPPLDIKDAAEKLDRYRAAASASSRASDNIKRMRDQLFEMCRRAGGQRKNGVYTLTAPTGTGKTLAVLAFALEQMMKFGKKRTIVVLPYLSIIEQNAAVYRGIIPQLIEDHSQAERGDEGARELSQRWDSPFIITTSVKFFESLFACTGPACRKLHRFADSVIIFDEAQSLPAELAGTTLNAVEELSDTYGSTVVFSTATQPKFGLLPHVFWQPEEIVQNREDLFKRADRVDTLWRLKSTLTARETAEEMAQHRNCCVIVNLRGQAAEIYRELKRLRGEDVFLLTSDLCPIHRTEVLSKVRDRLERGEGCLLAATQCIEAGVDISFDVMYRALAPLESIVQAAGRCNRGGSGGRGKLTVFVPEGKNIYPDSFYKRCANAVLTLSSRHEIDLNRPSHIEEYYEILFKNGGIDERKKLKDAVEKMDFEKVAEAYRLIEDDQLSVLVPYGSDGLFEHLAEEGRKGVTASFAAKAGGLAVRSYMREQIEKNCEKLYVMSEGVKTESGWYVLSNRAYYSEDRGLDFSEEFDGII